MKKNLLSRLAACVLAGIVSLTSVPVQTAASQPSDESLADTVLSEISEDALPAEEGAAEAEEDQLSEEDIAETGDFLQPESDITGMEEILGDRYISCTLEDGTQIAIRAMESFDEKNHIEAYKMRSLSEIQAAYENDEEVRDVYSIDDVESLLYQELGLADAEVFKADVSYDIHVIDMQGYEAETPQGLEVRLIFPENAGFSSENEKTDFEKTDGATLYHLKDDGTWEELGFEREEGQQTVIFHTDSFSPFVFGRVEEEAADPAESIDNEEDPQENENPDAEGSDIAQENENPDAEGSDVAQENENENSDADTTDSSIAQDGTVPAEASPAESGTDSAAENGQNNEEENKGASGNESDKSDEASINDAVSSADDEAKEEIVGADGEETKDPADYGLVEVGPSNDEKLLTDKELTAETRRLLSGGLVGAAPAVQEPITEDGMTIEKITIKWLSNSTGSNEPAGYDRLVLVPTDDDIAAQQWQMEFALSGKHEHEAGSVEIVMPASIWLDRDENEPGILTLAVPEEPETGSDFSWKRVDDTIVFTNIRNISAATKIMIQGSFRQMKAHEMVDIDVAEGSDYSDATITGVSEELFATINLVVPNGNVISMTSNTIDASVNTAVVAASASKTAYNPSSKEYYCYWDTPSDIPSDFLPENPDDYVYVKWYVTGQAQGNQPFTMTITDNANDEYGCLVLGVQDANGANVKSTDDYSTVTAELFSGYNTQPRSAYVWTAYEKSYFTEEMHLYTVHNTQTITVTGVDDLVVTTKEASAEASLALPIEYTVIKEWDDNDNELGVRPDHQLVRIYRNPEGDNERELWKTISLRENIDWTYSWSDEGKAWHYETEEVYMAEGTLDTWYDTDGKYHSTNWYYRQKKKTYNPDTRTWIYVNTLGQSVGQGDIADMWKRVWWQHDDPFQQSTRDRALNELLHGKDAIITYDVWGISSRYQAWYDCMVNGDLHAHRVNVVLEDDQHTDTDFPVLDPVMMNNKRVTAVEDYELAYADIDMPDLYGYTAAVRDPSLPEDDPNRYWPDRFVLARYIDEYTDATFEGLIDGEWVVLGELHNGEFEGKNGGVFDGSKLMFPEGVVRFRETVNSFGVATELKYAIGVKIHPSDFVLEQINTAAALSDYMMMTVDNYARLYQYDEGLNQEYVTDANPLGEDEGWELTDWDRGYLHGRVYRVAAWQDKQFELTGNDTARKRLKIHTTGTTVQQSNVLTRAEYNKAIADGDIPYTEGGTWYDLLPPGMEPDPSTVQLQSGDKIRDVYTIENYKGSGRTLLVVKASLGDHVTMTTESQTNPYYDDESYPKEGYKQTQVIEFDAFYSWEDARVYGLDGVRNTIVFQSDDEWVGNLNGWSGETDDPRSGGNKWTEESVRSDLDIITNLTSDAEDTPSFIYAGAPLIFENPDYTAETSIRKWVSAEGTGIWSYGHHNEAVVYEGGKYKYRINLTAQSDMETKNIIMIDSLENYVPTSDKESDYGDTQWRGYFRSIDISGLKAAGINPVVYYSTVPNLDISKKGGYNPEDQQGVIADILENATTDSGEKVWSKELPEDPGTVTAYAIDCRKTVDGKDFTLSKEETLAFYVYMKAPQEEYAEPYWCNGEGAAANPVREERDETNPDDNSHAYNNIYLDATQVDGIGRETHAYIHWDYVKVGLIPFNITLTKGWDDEDDNDGKRPDSVTVHLIREGVDTGKTVVLSEDNNWTGKFTHILRYDDDDNWINYSFEEDPVEGYTGSFTRRGDEVYMYNVHSPEKIEVPFRKVWDGDSENVRPKRIRVRLYADGIFTGKEKTVTADADGNWSGSFTNINKYNKGREIDYTVEEAAVDDYTTAYSEDGDIRIITNTYHPYGDLSVVKTLENATAAAGEVDFTFTLKLTDREGNMLTDKYNYETSDGRTGQIKSGDSFTLKGGQKFTIRDIPSHSRYSITEESAEGFTLSGREGNTGEILSYEESTASFTNTYSSRGSVNLSAKKILNGRTLASYQFRFQLDQIFDDGTEPVMLRLASNSRNGSAAFGAIRYTEADDGVEKVYRISEVNAGKDGYTYDSHIVYVKVTPTDNGGGTMTCTPVYYDSDWNVIENTPLVVMADGYTYTASAWEALSGEEQAAAKEAHVDEDTGSVEISEESDIPGTFLNDYKANGAIVLRAWKKLTGRKLTEGEFTFELLDGNSKVIQTATNLEDGSIIFNPISFTEKNIGKTYYFFVREKAGQDDTVNYDTAVFGYDVTVIDNGDGTLLFEQGHQTVEVTEDGTDVSYTASGELDDIPLFDNTLKDGSLTVSKFTTWQEGDTPDPDQEFHFKVKLINPDGTAYEDGELDYDLEQVENIGEQSDGSN